MKNSFLIICFTLYLDMLDCFYGSITLIWHLGHVLLKFSDYLYVPCISLYQLIALDMNEFSSQDAIMGYLYGRNLKKAWKKTSNRRAWLKQLHEHQESVMRLLFSWLIPISEIACMMRHPLYQENLFQTPCHNSSWKKSCEVSKLLFLGQTVCSPYQ